MSVIRPGLTMGAETYRETTLRDEVNAGAVKDSVDSLKRSEYQLIDLYSKVWGNHFNNNLRAYPMKCIDLFFYSCCKIKF